MRTGTAVPADMKWPIPEGWRELGDNEVILSTDMMVSEYNGDRMEPGACIGDTVFDVNAIGGIKVSQAAFIRQEAPKPVADKEWVNPWD